MEKLPRRRPWVSVVHPRSRSEPARELREAMRLVFRQHGCRIVRSIVGWADRIVIIADETNMCGVLGLLNSLRRNDVEIVFARVGQESRELRAQVYGHPNLASWVLESNDLPQNSGPHWDQFDRLLGTLPGGRRPAIRKQAETGVIA
jgi:hypothetical protein